MFRSSLISSALLLAFSSLSGDCFSDDASALAGSAASAPVSVTPRTAAPDSIPIARLASSVRTRVLVVHSPESDRSREELTKLSAPGGPFEILKKRGWKVGPESTNHIQIVDRTRPIEADIQPIVAQIPASDGPVVVSIEDGAVVRSFKRGCTTPLDQWTFGWLMTGNDDRPVDFDPEPVKVAATGNYRLRGNHWSIEGDWNPTRESVARHLRTSHPGSIQAGWTIESWSLEELRSLHDDIHDREEGFRGRYATSTTSPARSSGGAGLKKPGSTR